MSINVGTIGHIDFGNNSLLLFGHEWSNMGYEMMCQIMHERNQLIIDREFAPMGALLIIGGSRIPAHYELLINTLDDYSPVVIHPRREYRGELTVQMFAYANFDREMLAEPYNTPVDETWRERRRNGGTGVAKSKRAAKKRRRSKR